MRFRSLLLITTLSFSALAVQASTPPVDEFALASFERAPDVPGIRALTPTSIPQSLATAQVDAVPTPAPAKVDVMQLVLQYLVAPLLPVLGGLLMFALKKLTDYLTAKSAESKGALVAAKLTGAAASAVAEINATLRPELEAALADGVLTDAEKTKLKTAALELLKTRLPSELLGAASSIFGGFLDTYLGGLVERSLLEQKATAAIGARPS
jgi:hypothetical protein